MTGRPGGRAVIDYTTPGPLTDLSTVPPAALAGPADDPVGICRPVEHLVLQPAGATAAGLPEARLAENQLRPAARLVDVLLGLDPAPLVQPRVVEHRDAADTRWVRLDPEVLGTADLQR